MVKRHIFKQQQQKSHSQAEPTPKSWCWFSVPRNPITSCFLQDWNTVLAAPSSSSRSGRIRERKQAVPCNARAHLLPWSWEKRKESHQQPLKLHWYYIKKVSQYRSVWQDHRPVSISTQWKTERALTTNRCHSNTLQLLQARHHAILTI